MRNEASSASSPRFARNHSKVIRTCKAHLCFVKAQQPGATPFSISRHLAVIKINGSFIRGPEKFCYPMGNNCFAVEKSQQLFLPVQFSWGGTCAPLGCQVPFLLISPLMQIRPPPPLSPKIYRTNRKSTSLNVCICIPSLKTYTRQFFMYGYS